MYLVFACILRFAVSGHVQEVRYQDIPDTPFCLLKSKVTPSMRIRDKPHEPWVYLIKDTAVVHCAHCTCMAGYVSLLILKKNHCKMSYTQILNFLKIQIHNYSSE